VVQKVPLFFPSESSRADNVDYLTGFGTMRREVPDAGYIAFPDYVDSINIIEEYRRQKRRIPAALAQWRKERDFHRVPVNVKLGRMKESRGAVEFSMTGWIWGPGGTLPPQADDVGPKTEWVNGPVSGKMDLGLSIGAVGSLLKFLASGMPTPEANIEFTYTWNPKVAAVTSGASGDKVEWNFSRAEGKYLGGGHQLELIVRRPRGVSSLILTILRASVRYETAFRRGPAFIRKGVKIPVNFRESAPQ
jgi:hypothetical protein